MRRAFGWLVRRILDALDPQPISAPWSSPEEQRQARQGTEQLRDALRREGLLRR